MTQESRFLSECQKSSQAAYDAFKELLARLENESERRPALELFHDLAAQLVKKHSSEELMQRYHFSLSELVLKLEEGGETKLLLLQLPSTFAPEEWSFTFFEGLTRYKVAEFQDRRIAELGCGTGWISLALAKQTKPAKVYGLDINPRAIVCSRINLYLNGYDREGNPTWTHEGRTLPQVVEFHQSDLLEHCRTHKLILDRIIGCIPQVLNPDPEFTTRMLAGGVSEGDSDEFLHSLSNYAPVQGHIEDQFGLGLIARAVEESVEVMRGSGKLILNLGGRPGTSVLHQLFLRRGFTCKQVWQTRVSQAKDTDIRGLVAIEEKSPHRFEFYMEHGSDAPISAKTALAYAEAGGEIAHGLSVYEAQLRDPLHVPAILKLLTRSGYEDARRAVDLSYPEDALAVEKMSFLNALAERIEEYSFFPYEETAGATSFRRRLGRFFSNYFRIPYDESCFLIGPSSLELCRNALAIYHPKKALVDSQVFAAIQFENGSDGVLEIPRSLDLVCELMEKLKPEMVIYSMPENEARTIAPFLRMLEIAEKSNSRVFVDISELIELSSRPASNAIFRYLAQNPLPLHVALVCGLVKNRIYGDLQVSFLMSENRSLLKNLTHAAELTYSRTPILSQLYYDRILQDLLNFQIADSQGERVAKGRAQLEESADFSRRFVGVSTSAREAFSHASVVGEAVGKMQGSKFRLDYGENCLPSPESVKRALFEAFAKIRIPSEEADPRSEVLELVRTRFGIPELPMQSVALGGGVAPLFSDLARHCSSKGHTLVFPSGSYGYFVASANFHGAKVKVVPTKQEQHYKVEAKSLDEALSKAGKGAWVILSAPVVNPTGAVYTPQEVESLLTVVRKHQGVAILDSIFSGLEFEAPPSFRLMEGRWAVLGGFSKEYAAGGLRVGYGVSNDSEVLSAWKRSAMHQPHSTLRFVIKKLLRKQLKKDPELDGVLEHQKQVLRERAKKLTQVLKKSGWEPLPSEGGLFLVATPKSLVGRSLDGTRIDLGNVAELLRSKTGIVINTPAWTGIPGYFRFVLSISDHDFDQAIQSMESFFRETRG